MSSPAEQTAEAQLPPPLPPPPAAATAEASLPVRHEGLAYEAAPSTHTPAPTPTPAPTASAAAAAASAAAVTPLSIAQLHLTAACQLFPSLPVTAAGDLAVACAALGISRGDIKRVLQRPGGDRLLAAALAEVPELDQARGAELVRCLNESLRREWMWNYLAVPGLMVATFTVVSVIGWVRNNP